MQRLLKTIEGKERWNVLTQYTELIDVNRVENPNVALDATKSVLESITKTILTDKNVKYDTNSNLGFLVKTAFTSLPVFAKLEDGDVSNAKSILGSFANISGVIGTFRNNHGFFSHGRDLQSEKFDIYLVELAISSADVLASFLITAHSEDLKDRTRIYYEEHDEFNRYLDETSEEYPVVRGIQLNPSQALFVDEEAYKEELNNFITEKVNLIERLNGSKKFISTRSIARDIIPIQKYLTNDEVLALVDIAIDSPQVHNLLKHGYTRNLFSWVLSEKSDVLQEGRVRALRYAFENSLY